MSGEPYSNQKAKSLVRTILESGVLSFSRHAYEEMKSDRLDESDVRNVLRGGSCRFAEEQNRTWRYRFETDKVAVVVAFRTERNAVVVTVFALRRK